MCACDVCVAREPAFLRVLCARVRGDGWQEWRSPITYHILLITYYLSPITSHLLLIGWLAGVARCPACSHSWQPSPVPSPSASAPSSSAAAADSAQGGGEEKKKTVVSCPSCQQKLRVPAGECGARQTKVIRANIRQEKWSSSLHFKLCGTSSQRSTGRDHRSSHG